MNTLNRLVLSNLAAQCADQVAIAAIPIIAALWLGAGPGAAGALAAAQTLPFLLLSLPAGVLADRVSRRRLMVAAEALRAGALALVPLAAWAGSLSVWTLGAIGCLAATGTVVYSVTAPALVPSLVPRAAVGAANARLELARSTAFAAGPALAGSLIAWTGPSAAFAVATILSAAAAILLAGLPHGAAAPGPSIPVAQALREGWRFSWSHPLIRPILLTAVAWNLAWFVLQSVYVLYAVQRLGLDAAGIGTSLAMYGVGMVAGALAAPGIMRRLGFGWVIACGPLASVGAAALLLATLAWPRPGLAYAAFTLFGAGPILWTIAQTTLRQAVTPGALLGRVSAIFMVASSGARPIGALLGGITGQVFGLESAIALAAAGIRHPGRDPDGLSSAPAPTAAGRNGLTTRRGLDQNMSQSQNMNTR